jgi:hypothetical protein
MPICKICNQEKPIEKFKRKSTGKIDSYVCHPCRSIPRSSIDPEKVKRMKLRDKEYRDSGRSAKSIADFTKKRMNFINSFKDVPCVDCGQKFPPECMDFDHVSADKLENVSRMRRFSKERLVNEIKKCEVVCANCHRIRTKKSWIAGLIKNKPRKGLT